MCLNVITQWNTVSPINKYILGIYLKTGCPMAYMILQVCEKNPSVCIYEIEKRLEGYISK